MVVVRYPRVIQKYMMHFTAMIVGTLTLYASYMEYQSYRMSQQYQQQQQQQQPKLTSSFDHHHHNNHHPDMMIDPKVVAIMTLPRVYDWEALNTYWSHRPLSTLYRLLQINYYLVPLLYRYVQDFVLLPQLRSVGKWNDIDADTALSLQQSHAMAWKDALTQLGPAFIKAGQQISIRPDLVSPIVLQTLQQLCDNVTPISDEMAYQILQQELHITQLHDLFVEPPRLVAAASLGQVYRATLKTTDTTTTATTTTPTTEVAIKIQRPGMLESFSLDLFLLQRFSILVDTFTSLFTHQPPFHKALYESFANGSYAELDYEHEAQQQMFFYHEFQKRTIPVVIPKVYTEYTTRTVLTSQWIDGIKLADAPVEQIRALIPVGVELFLTQLLDLGIFHADPHVGNLLVQNTTGRLCLIDFGLCTTVSEKDRRAMTMAIVHMLQRDFQTLIHQDSKELGFLPQDCDTTELFPILTKILTVGLLDSPSSNIRIRRRKLLEISNELNDVFFHYPFTVPPYFALITRGLGLLEGIALSGDADFDIFQAAAPYARRRAMQILYGRISNNKKKPTPTVAAHTPSSPSSSGLPSTL
jgi:aarF domain-containing kinase